MEPRAMAASAAQRRPSPLHPKLERLDPAKPHTFIRPTKRIIEGSDMSHFLTSGAYRDIMLFIFQLNRSLCPRKKTAGSSAPTPTPTPGPPRARARADPNVQTFTLSAGRNSDIEPIKKLRELLKKVDAIIDEAPPDKNAGRRFGYAQFRDFYALLEQRADSLLKEYLPQHVLGFSTQQQPPESGEGRVGPMEELKAYFLGSWGSQQRLDYGTGHELSFLVFLGCLYKLGAFQDDSRDTDEISRSIVFGVIEPYLKVARRLILTYMLEPAGSHGVWGLDDHSFMPYIFGSAQLTRPISSETEPMPLEGSVAGAPKPSDVVKVELANPHKEENMYFSAIGFINDVKTGPFWEHSPMLFDISGITDGWGKVNKGMLKMYDAEVLHKFPVVQHFPFGSLFSWEADPAAAKPERTVHMAQQPTATLPQGGGGGTRTPWAQTGGTTGGIAAPMLPRNPPAAAAAAAAGDAGASSGRFVSDVPSTFPQGDPGTASAQYSITAAPWAKKK
ncbi:Serine/threonine-protein phosphatase 2A activator 1 [Diplogelasinospora grovesii]|uniref:Serine/threonine-protein phosphatase 2A activator n=1 Tax=Diplogelasinospora grovesii TaxID=303347 RepID=A0AAN6SAB3_9PEZI|nr:Serine/threonine-protein phosphatase 2A activator 1 [Diplogelasinospora grovesii]